MARSPKPTPAPAHALGRPLSPDEIAKHFVDAARRMSGGPTAGVCALTLPLLGLSNIEYSPDGGAYGPGAVFSATRTLAGVLPVDFTMEHCLLLSAIFREMAVALGADQ